MSLKGRGVTSTKFFKAFVCRFRCQRHGVSLFVAPSSGHFWDYLQRHLAVIFGTILQRHLVVIFGTICSAIYRSFLNYLQRHLAVIFELFAAPSSGHFGTICSAI